MGAEAGVGVLDWWVRDGDGPGVRMGMDWWLAQWGEAQDGPVVGRLKPKMDRLAQEFTGEVLGCCAIDFYRVFKFHPVMGVVYDHQRFVGDALFFEPTDQVDALIETDIAIVVALDDQYG